MPTAVRRRPKRKMSDECVGEKISVQHEPVITVETSSGHDDGKKTAKLVYTFFILLVYFVGGALKGQEGVTFLDLLLLTGSGMESGSLILTCSALGFMLGPLLLGFLYDRYNNSGLFALFIAASGLTTFLIPWCHHLILMSAAFVLRNLLTSAMDIGALVITVKLWKNEVNPYMQAIQAMFALGGIVSPLVTAPFLSDSTRVAATRYNNDSVTTDSVDFSSVGDINSTIIVPVYSYPALSSNTTPRLNHSQPAVVTEQTNVHIAYAIIGASMLVVGIPVAVLWLSRFGETLIRQKNVPVDHRLEQETPSTVHSPRRSRVLPLAITIVGVFFFVYGPVEKTCANFLLSFLVKQLRWSKVLSAQGNSAFYAGFAGGRFIGIGLAVVLPTTLMLFVFMIALVVCFGLFIIAVQQSVVFVWVCIVLMGLAMSTIYASMYAWVDANVTSVTGKMASCMQVTLALGTMATTPLIGYLFEEQTPMWFLYLTIITSSICLVSYCLLYGLTSKFPFRKSNAPFPEKDSFLNEDEDAKP